jgi:putative aldouronate transport system substrate-binding protein
VCSSDLKVYGLSPWLGDWGLWSFTIYPQGFNSIFAEAGGFTDIDCRTGEITSQIGNTNSTLWQGAKFFNKAHQAGILDPDSLLQKYDQAQDKQNAGRVLMGAVNWGVSGANGAFAKNGHPERGFMALKLPSSYTMAANLFKNPYTDRWAMAVTTKCKEKEKAVGLINFLNSKDGMRLLLNGIEGKNWKVGDGGVPRLTPETLKLFNESTPQDLETEGFGCYTHLYGYSQDSWDSKYNCYAQFKYNEDPVKLMDTATPFEKDYAEHYGVAYPDQIFEKSLPDQKLIFDGSFMQMVEQAPAEIKQVDDKLLNYLLVQMVKIVTSKDDAAFEAAQKKIIEDCGNMGYEQAFDWHKKNFETAMEKVDEFYKAIGK